MPTTDMTARGGSWYRNPGYARASNRFGHAPADRNYVVGFRCVRRRDSNFISARGGSWFLRSRHARASYRCRSHPAIRVNLIAFRCVRSRYDE